MLYRYTNEHGLKWARVVVSDQAASISFDPAVDAPHCTIELPLAYIQETPIPDCGSMLSFGEAAALLRGERWWVDLLALAKNAGMSVPDYAANQAKDSFPVRALIASASIQSMRSVGFMLFMRQDAVLECDEPVEIVDGPLKSRRLLEELVAEHNRGYNVQQP